MAIQKLNYGWQAGGGYVEPTHEVMCDKINALIDAVNELHEEAENNARIRANHENLIDTLVEENNIHEKQIDELQTKVNKLAPNINFAQPEVKENAQPDYVTTSYMTDGHTKEYYGQNGASIVTDPPLPAGYVITIKEKETDKEAPDPELVEEYGYDLAEAVEECGDLFKKGPIEPVTITDVFNEMQQVRADLWNKIEWLGEKLDEIKGGDNE